MLAWRAAVLRCMPAGSCSTEGLPSGTKPAQAWTCGLCVSAYACCHVQVMGARSFKGPVLALLAANTAVTMTQTDGFLSTRLFNEFYSGFPTRMDAVISGGGRCCSTLCTPQRAAAHARLHTSSCMGVQAGALSGSCQSSCLERDRVGTTHVLIGYVWPAGFALVSFFNVLIILSLGFVDEEEKKKISIPHRAEFTRANSAYSNHSCGGLNGIQT